MTPYFKPWRRKFGMAMLVMACVFAAGWIRSIFISEQILIPTRNRSTQFLVSGDQLFIWCRATVNDPNQFWIWPYMRYSDPTEFATTLRAMDSCQWRFGLYRFGVAEGAPTANESNRLCLAIVPYFTIVMPLTMVSAYLLFSKPRKSIQKKDNRPPVHDGT